VKIPAKVEADSSLSARDLARDPRIGGLAERERERERERANGLTRI